MGVNHHPMNKYDMPNLDQTPFSSTPRCRSWVGSSSTLSGYMPSGRRPSQVTRKELCAASKRWKSALPTRVMNLRPVSHQRRRRRKQLHPPCRNLYRLLKRGRRHHQLRRPTGYPLHRGPYTIFTGEGAIESQDETSVSQGIVGVP